MERADGSREGGEAETAASAAKRTIAPDFMVASTLLSDPHPNPVLLFVVVASLAVDLVHGRVGHRELVPILLQEEVHVHHRRVRCVEVDAREVAAVGERL